MKKTLSLVLSLVLVLSFCFVQGSAEEEPRVLTMGGKTSFADFLNFDSYQKLQKDLNIRIEYTYYNDDSYSAMLAGRELPDIVLGGDDLDIVLGGNLAMDMSPYLDQMPNVTGPQYGATLELTRDLYGGKERAAYVFCPVIGQHVWNGGTYMVERGYSVNWEYYKELGCPSFDNDDEYIEILKEMQANHPTTEDGSPTYLFGVMGSLSKMGGFRAAFRADIAQNPWTTYLYKPSIYGNKLINNYTDIEHSSYWADMEFYNKIFRAGLWDMDCFTMTNDEYNAKKEKGQYMGIEEAARSQSVYLVVPTSNETLYANVILPLGNAPGNYTFVSANTENLDLCIEYLNYLHDPDFNRLMYSGVQGKDWDYDENGVPSLTDEAIAARASGDLYWSENGNGYGYRWWYTNPYNPAVTHTDGYPMDLSFTPEVLAKVQTAQQLDFCEQFGVDFWLDAFKNVGTQDFLHDAKSLIVSSIIDIPMDVKRTLETCNDIMYAAMPELIMAESDESFEELREKVLAELAEAGEEAAWEWYEEAWQAPMEQANATIDSIIKELGIEE